MSTNKQHRSRQQDPEGESGAGHTRIRGLSYEEAVRRESRWVQYVSKYWSHLNDFFFIYCNKWSMFPQDMRRRAPKKSPPVSPPSPRRPRLYSSLTPARHSLKSGQVGGGFGGAVFRPVGEPGSFLSLPACTQSMCSDILCHIPFS